MKTLCTNIVASGAKPGHSFDAPEMRDAMNVPWPNVSALVFSDVQLIRSAGSLCLKCGWPTPRPVSKTATVAFAPASPAAHAGLADAPGATSARYLRVGVYEHRSCSFRHSVGLLASSS